MLWFAGNAGNSPYCEPHNSGNKEALLRKEKGICHEKLKNTPKEPIRHCAADVSLVFSENSSTKNSGIPPFFKVVYHCDPSVPKSVNKPFNSA